MFTGLQDCHLDEHGRDDTKSEMANSQSLKIIFRGFHATCYSSDGLFGSYTV